MSEAIPEVRGEVDADRAAVHALNVAAFEAEAEADLVDRLRKAAHPSVSLVAVLEGEVVGHILFTPVSLDGHPQVKLFGLAPMAVAPRQQRKGIGSALVQAGLEACGKAGFEAGVVLGHPEYYPRFGFRPAYSGFGITSTYGVPDEVFLALELVPGSLQGRSGTVHYHEAFAEA